MFDVLITAHQQRTIINLWNSHCVWLSITVNRASPFVSRRGLFTRNIDSIVRPAVYSFVSKSRVLYKELGRISTLLTAHTINNRYTQYAMVDRIISSAVHRLFLHQQETWGDHGRARGTAHQQTGGRQDSGKVTSSYFTAARVVSGDKNGWLFSTSVRKIHWYSHRSMRCLRLDIVPPQLPILLERTWNKTEFKRTHAHIAVHSLSSGETGKTQNAVFRSTLNLVIS